MDVFEAFDKRFAAYSIPIVFLEKLHGGLRWAEGPVYFGDQRCLILSDLPNNRMLRWDEETVKLPIFRAAQFFQRQYTRPRGPPRHLRASGTAGHAHGTTARSRFSRKAIRASV